MATGIKDKIAIIGMGCTKFGEQWDKSGEDLIIEAFEECLADAGIEKKEIEAGYFGTHYDEVNVGKSAIPMAVALKLPYIPVTRTENFCATATEAFRGACYAVASGSCDIALALGMEKLKDTGYGGLPNAGSYGVTDFILGTNWTAPGQFAQLATAYSATYGLPMEKIKEAIAHVSVKSHKNGAMNPKAHLRRPVTKEQVMSAPMIAYPLGLFDCCGVSDGSAAAIVTTPEIAKSLKKDNDFVLVKSIQIACTSGEESIYNNWDGAHVESTTRASLRAYEEGGIKNPREEINLLELHDCFSITEFVTYEDIHISPRGKAYDDVMSGFYDLDGKVPCQVDGGLKCFGHPIGASGLRMLYALYEQILERVPDERKVKNARLGLAHNLGGIPNYNVVSIAIVGRN
ncbi:MAG TPA: acetyl-CoA acetyltransferase [Deltaproteobacteria bacterium]|nr:acetyl-CoA acetyltransferase [Deltaproteobacteria bacterium]